MPEQAPGALRSLIEIGVSLARRTASGRVLMARCAPLVDERALPEELRAPVRAELDAAWAAVVEPLDARTIAKAAPRTVEGVAAEPLAVTPTAQVHRAELDGEPVAVKVARPGVAATIRSELALLDTLAAPMRMVFPALDVRGVLREVREAVMDELDLEHEAETQHRVRRALRRLDGVEVPEAHVDESGPGVLVTGHVQGPTLDRQAPRDPERVAELLVAAHLVAWREAGLVLTDPRPNHVILTAGGIALLGTGLARPHERERMGHFVAAFAALGAGDRDGFNAALEALELLPADHADAAFALLRELLGEFGEGEAVLDAAALERGSHRALDRIGELVALAGRATPDPADAAAGRMVAQLVATLARLEARADWPALAARAANAG